MSRLLQTARCSALRGLLAFSAGVLPATAAAQNVPDDSETARLHVGPLALTPRIGLRNLGVDTNIFNNSVSPQRDATATFTAANDAWLRVGRAYFSSKTNVDWHYFQKTPSQRSLDVDQEGRIDVDLLRFVPRLGGSVLNSRQGPNDEFDVRVQQRHAMGFAGLMVPIGTKGRLDFELREEEYDYSIGKFGDRAVASALNRKSQLTVVRTGFDLTPLTRFVIKADRREDRFAFTQQRNSESLRIMPGVEMQPSALISGNAFVGYRRFRTPSATVPDIRGVVAAVELRFVAADVFRISGQVSHDVDYSLELDESIYLSTVMATEIVQAVGLDWDVVGRVRHSSLVYQQVDPSKERLDRLWLTGAGFGRRIGTELRVGFDVNYVNRASPRPDRAYDGLRYGISFTYGY